MKRALHRREAPVCIVRRANEQRLDKSMI